MARFIFPKEARETVGLILSFVTGVFIFVMLSFFMHIRCDEKSVISPGRRHNVRYETQTG